MNRLNKAVSWVSGAFAKLAEKLSGIWTKLDQRADQKLGFVSAPLFGTLLGGGIPAWLASRLVIVGVALLAGWYVVDKYNAGVVADRDTQWKAKLEREVADATKVWKQKADETRREVEKVNQAWKSEHDKLSEYTDKLEAVLRTESEKNAVLSAKCAVSEKALEVLRAKVRRINKGRALK